MIVTETAGRLFSDPDLRCESVLCLSSRDAFSSSFSLHGINPGHENVMEQVHFAKRF